MTPSVIAELAGQRATVRRPPVLPIAAMVAGLAIVLWLVRDASFFHDDWSFIVRRQLTIADVLRAHNEHFSATLVLLYRTLVGAFGTGSYWPFILPTVALHTATAGLVFVAARREAPMAWAVGAMAVMIVLGSGGYDILWAFQSGTVGAVASGLAALLIAPRRPGVAAALLVVSVATSGVALAFVAGTGVHLALTRPRAMPWLAVPMLAYLAWFVTFGAGAVSNHQAPTLDGVPMYVAYGLAVTAAGVVGSTSIIVGGIVLGALAVLLYLTRYVSPLMVALAAVDVGFLVVSGLVRASGNAAAAGESRYVYVLAPAFLVIGVALLSRVRLGSRLAVAVLAVSLVGNVALLAATHDEIQARVACERSIGWPATYSDAGNGC